MIFFTFSEIVISLLCSIFLGVIFGGVYFASELLLSFVKGSFLIIPRAFLLSRKLSITNMKIQINAMKRVKLFAVEKNIFEFFVFLFFGISFIVLSYITLDGSLRAYMLIPLCLFGFISYKYLGNFFSSVFYRLFLGIYSISVVSLAVCFLPLCRFYVLLQRLFVFILFPLKLKIIKKRSLSLLNRKICMIYKISDV